MNRQEIIGGATALKGAGLVGTFTFLDGIRLLDGMIFSVIIWALILLGAFLILLGLGIIAKAES